VNGGHDDRFTATWSRLARFFVRSGRRAVLSGKALLRIACHCLIYSGIQEQSRARREVSLTEML